MKSNGKKETIIFGGGCFWCTEAVFKLLRGVTSILPGYTGGTKVNPTYSEVCTGTTGHVEVVQIEYNSNLVKLEDLLTIFFASHDPTSFNKQGNDIGTQYRSVIFYTTNNQKDVTENFIKDINESNAIGKSIVTEIKPLDKFYLAEDYHKNYFANNKEQAYCQIVINPKLEKIKSKYSILLKKIEK